MHKKGATRLYQCHSQRAAVVACIRCTINAGAEHIKTRYEGDWIPKLYRCVKASGVGSKWPVKATFYGLVIPTSLNLRKFKLGRPRTITVDIVFNAVILLIRDCGEEDRPTRVWLIEIRWRHFSFTCARVSHRAHIVMVEGPVLRWKLVLN